ncbi:MAG: ornithine carbamoyltransferase [Nitrospirota bacterium]|nr:ornithine carbamoyltransferase [Nitrospirota bacterium]
MKDFLTIGQLTRTDLVALLDQAASLKEIQKRGGIHQPLAGKSVGLIFQKSSTRTRVSFEVGIFQLGGQSIFLSPHDIQLGRGETVADTARVLSRYLHAVVIRTYGQQIVEELAHYAEIPIINGLTDQHHPCQALADLLTVREQKGHLEGLKLAYIGDGNNMAHSLIEAAALSGMHISVAAPEGYRPDETIVANARSLAGAGKVDIVVDPFDAARDADVLYTDVWASMGQEAETEARKKIFKPYQINRALLKEAGADAIVMHCLPAHRGEEITEEVLEGPRSVVWDQAENRLHTQKAVLELLLGS